MRSPHIIQMQILKKLLYNPSLRYMEMKPDPALDNNKFDFHLDRLVDLSYVEKVGNRYLLTPLGKEFAGRMDTEKVRVEKQAKVSVFVAPIRQRGGSREYLIYTRLKQPFYGCQGFLSGKICYGEKVLEAAARELTEETGLTGTPEITSVRHYLVFDKVGGELLEEKVIFFCRAQNPIGALKSFTDERHEWVTEEKALKYVTNHFESSERFKKDIEEISNFSGTISFEEVIHVSNKF